MKNSIILFCLVTILVATNCKNNRKNVIKQGNWTIENPVRYAFEYKTIGAYTFGPTLTTGSNGVMLTLQTQANNRNAGIIKGQLLNAFIKTDKGDLKTLDEPENGELTTLLDIPIAIWYFEPPGKSNSITTFKINFNGNTASWDFSSGRKLPD